MLSRFPPFPLFPLVAVTLITACATDDQPTQQRVTRDSAGVSITEYTRSQLEQLPVTALTEPDVRIGRLDGEPNQQLHQVRGVTRLNDGAIVVLNAGTHEVRLYDAQGDFMDAIGRQGRGPGEFTLPVLLRQTAADTIVVYDLAEQRFTFIGFSDIDVTQGASRIRDGVARTQSSPGWLSGLTGMLDSTRVLLAAPPRVAAEGLVELPLVVSVLDLETGAADTIGTFGRRQEVRTVQGEIIVALDVPYTVYAMVREHDGEVYLIDGISPDVRVYGSDGRLERIMRFTDAARPVSSAEFDDHVEQRARRSLELTGSRESRGLTPDEARRVYDSMRLPGMQPFHDQLIVANNGDIWLREFELMPEGLHTWTVLDQEGVPTARFRTPAGLTVREAGADYVLGVYRDELDVEYVQLYSIEAFR